MKVQRHIIIEVEPGEKLKDAGDAIMGKLGISFMELCGASLVIARKATRNGYKELIIKNRSM